MQGRTNPGVWVEPALFAILVCSVFVVALAPVYRFYGHDISAFIVAGGRYVDSAGTSSHIIVRPHSAGYDGQFYYRMAVDPFSSRLTDHGVRFDAPAYRMGRIFYPLCVHLLTLGRSSLVPFGMFAANVAALGAIAFIAMRLTIEGRLERWTPILVSVCPGFIAALSHDTTEIWADALLLAAIAAALSGRLLLFALAGAASILTRETVALVLAGFLINECLAWRRKEAPRRIAAAAFVFVPAILWRCALAWIAPAHLGRNAFAENIGVPLRGALARVHDDLAGWKPGLDHRTLGHWLLDSIDLGVTIVLLASSLLAITASGRAIARGGAWRSLAIGWLMTALLMSTLRENGPWIDPVGSTRAFCTCWICGWLLLGSAPPRLLRGRGAAAFLAPASAVMFLSVTVYIYVQVGLIK